MSHTPKGGLSKEAMQNNCNGDKELEDVVETLFSLDTRTYELTFGEQCRELYYLKKTEKFRDITLKRIGTLLGVSGNVISVHARREQKTKKEVGRPCLLNAEMKKYVLEVVKERVSNQLATTIGYIRRLLRSRYSILIPSRSISRFLKNEGFQLVWAIPDEQKRVDVEEKAMVKYFQDLSQMVKGVRKELIFNVDEIGFQRWADKQKIKVIWQEEKKYDDKDDDEEREELEYMEEEIVDLKKEIEKIDEEKAELKKEIKRKSRLFSHKSVIEIEEMRSQKSEIKEERRNIKSQLSMKEKEYCEKKKQSEIENIRRQIKKHSSKEEIKVGVDRDIKRTTQIACINGCGPVDNLLVTPYKTITPEFSETGLLWTCNLCHSKSGFISTEIFYSWLLDIFIPSVYHIRQKNNLPDASPALLIMDGCSCHKIENIENMLKIHNIRLLLLVAHSSHLTQMLDVGIFGAQKKKIMQEGVNVMKTSKSRNTIITEAKRKDNDEDDDGDESDDESEDEDFYEEAVDVTDELNEVDKVKNKERLKRQRKFEKYQALIIDSFISTTTPQNCKSAFESVGITFYPSMEDKCYYCQVDPNCALKVKEQFPSFLEHEEIKDIMRNVKSLSLNKRTNIKDLSKISCPQSTRMIICNAEHYYERVFVKHIVQRNELTQSRETTGIEPSDLQISQTILNENEDQCMAEEVMEEDEVNMEYGTVEVDNDDEAEEETRERRRNKEPKRRTRKRCKK